MLYSILKSTCYIVVENIWTSPMLVVKGVYIRSDIINHVGSYYYFLVEWNTWACHFLKLFNNISIVLSKFDSSVYGTHLWNMFFTTIKPSLEFFFQESEGSETPNNTYFIKFGNIWLQEQCQNWVILLFCNSRSTV